MKKVLVVVAALGMAAPAYAAELKPTEKVVTPVQGSIAIPALIGGLAVVVVAAAASSNGT